MSILFVGLFIVGIVLIASKFTDWGAPNLPKYRVRRFSEKRWIVEIQKDGVIGNYWLVLDSEGYQRDIEADYLSYESALASAMRFKQRDLAEYKEKQTIKKLAKKFEKDNPPTVI